MKTGLLKALKPQIYHAVGVGGGPCDFGDVLESLLWNHLMLFIDSIGLRIWR